MAICVVFFWGILCFFQWDFNVSFHDFMGCEWDVMGFQ